MEITMTGVTKKDRLTNEDLRNKSRVQYMIKMNHIKKVEMGRPPSKEAWQQQVGVQNNQLDSEKLDTKKMATKQKMESKLSTYRGIAWHATDSAG